jgi:major membrane immunogen (membrane-anchored lipoprotein)
MKQLVLIAASVALLSACGDKPQSAGGVKSDAAPYTGTGKAYVEKGWKEGDKVSWESQLKARGMNTQNEYSKSN